MTLLYVNLVASVSFACKRTIGYVRKCGQQVEGKTPAGSPSRSAAYPARASELGCVCFILVFVFFRRVE